jgi:hypothetical protein
MGGVLTREAEQRGNMSGPNRLQADQADSGNSMVAVPFGSKTRRQLSLQDIRRDPEIDENPAANHALDDG